MKKSLFLGILPVIFALSACNGGAIKNNQEDNNIFLEDTLAHDEAFGRQENGLQPRRAIGDVENPDTDSDPAIGVQSIVEDGKVSFRFVAAVSFTNSQLDPTQAVWKRTISKPDGTAYANATTNFDTGTFECEKVYTKLSSDGDAYTIAQYNAAHGTTFSHFVVYTVRNIPLNAGYNDYYVSAYLTLSPKAQGGVSQTTKAIAISVDRSEKYTYGADLGEYFLKGTFADPAKSSGIVRANSTRTSTEVVADIATFDDLALSEGDTFSIMEFYDTKLYVHGSNYLKGSTNPIRHYFDCTESNITSNFDGNYDLYINHDSQLWATVNSVDDTERYLYVYSKVNWFFSNDATVALYAFGSGGNHIYQLQYENAGNYKWVRTIDKVDTSLYDTVIPIRCNKSTIDFDDFKWADVWNQTNDLELTNAEEDCAYVNGDNDGEMGLRIVS